MVFYIKMYLVINGRFNFNNLYYSNLKNSYMNVTR